MTPSAPVVIEEKASARTVVLSSLSSLNTAPESRAGVELLFVLITVSFGSVLLTLSVLTCAPDSVVVTVPGV